MLEPWISSTAALVLLFTSTTYLAFAFKVNHRSTARGYRTVEYGRIEISASITHRGRVGWAPQRKWFRVGARQAVSTKHARVGDPELEERSAERGALRIQGHMRRECKMGDYACEPKTEWHARRRFQNLYCARFSGHDNDVDNNIKYRYSNNGDMNFNVTWSGATK
eukprot:6214822-Pleurochrysis_carterae.AAC.5